MESKDQVNVLQDGWDVSKQEAILNAIDTCKISAKESEIKLSEIQGLILKYQVNQDTRMDDLVAGKDEEIQSLKDELSRVKEELVSLNKRIKGIAKERDNALTNYSDLRTRYSHLRVEYDQFVSGIDESLDDIGRKRAKVGYSVPVPDVTLNNCNCWCHVTNQLCSTCIPNEVVNE